uniref:exodeoxyribonuclease III n=1 Tax=Xenopus tropicalis TaxID=8364 RepID=A0A803J7S1_XENTR
MVNVYSINARGLNTPQKRNLVLHEAYRAKADLIFIQETHFKKSNHPNFYNRKYPHNYHAYSKTKSKGVSILISSKIPFQMHQMYADPLGRYLMLICNIGDQMYTLINIYVPNDNQLQYLNKTLTHLLEHKRGKCIVAGDFNSIMDPTQDIARTVKKQITKQQAKTAQKLRDFFHKLALIDTWRAKNPEHKEFTYYSPRHSMHSRIDMIFTDRQTTTSITKAWIGIQNWSDHAPTGIEIARNRATSNIAPWRLNETLLSRQDDQNIIKQNIKEYFKNNKTEEIGPQCLWLAHKATLRGEFIAMAKKKRKESEKQRANIEHKIKL